MNLIRCVCLCAVLMLGAARAKPDVVTAWNALALDAIRNESTPPPLAARNLAILHAAIYDAVNSIDFTHEPYLTLLDALPGASLEAAAVGAAYECLTDLYPSQTAAFDTAFQTFLARTLDTTNRADGLLLGQIVAIEILAWRSADGSSTTVPYVPSSEPGAWLRTPPFFRPPDLPHWAFVEPFTLTNGAQFRPPGPPALTDSRYAADLNQVKALGAVDSTNRTPEQTLIAQFWSDFSYTVTPPGHWNQIAQNIVTNRPTTLAENARLFVLLNLALADAGIVAWDAKYSYNLWRPITAIQQADTDANPDTEADPTWLPLLITPSFPEYVSGHSAFSSAAATVLGSFLGTDHVSFTVGSDAVPGVFRSYGSLDAAAEEIALSRIYGGIHFLSGNVDGLNAGRQVGMYIFEHHLRPISNPARVAIAQGPANNRLVITVLGTTARNYVLEVSSNLRHWSPISTNPAPFVFEDTVIDQNARFYRAVSR